MLFFAYPPLLRLLGAAGQVLEYAENYAFVVTLGSLFQVVGAGLVVLLRCDGRTGLAMLYTAAGLVIHILLDWLLVGKYVLYGVAVSTVAAQAAVMLLGLCSFRVRCGIRMNMASAGEILRSSLAPFGVNFVSSLVLLFTNYFALRSGGTAAVSAYGVMSYAVYTYDYVFQGVCDGVQPVISYCAGAGDAEQKKRAVRSSVLLLAGLSVLFALITPLMIGWLPKLFAVSAEAEAFMRSGLVIQEKQRRAPRVPGAHILPLSAQAADDDRTAHADARSEGSDEGDDGPDNIDRRDPVVARRVSDEQPVDIRVCPHQHHRDDGGQNVFGERKPHI